MAYRVADDTLIGSIAFDTDEIIGDGGWTTKLDAADDGTMVSGTDACGPRIRGPNDRKWRKLFMPGINAPMIDVLHSAQGTYAVATCATDSAVAYWVTGGNLWKTDDGGVSATLTDLIDIEWAESNEATRMTGKEIAVDPENPDVVLAGTPAGLYYSDDGGDTVSLISTGTIPAPEIVYSLSYYSGTGAFVMGATVTGATSGATAVIGSPVGIVDHGYLLLLGVTGTFASGENLQVSGVTKAVASGAQTAAAFTRYIICFDRNSAVVGGKTQGISVFTTRPDASASGLYRTTNGAASWSNVAGGPFTAAHMRVSPHDGFHHLAGNGTNGGESTQYRRWDKSSWTAPTDIVGKALAISPHTAGHIHMVNDGSYLASSTNNGVDWWPYAVPTRRAVDIPWMEWAEESYMSNGDIEFQGNINRLWLSEGIGTWYKDSPPTTNVASVEWLEASVGRESMVMNPMDVDPNGRLLASMHDRRAMVFERADVGRVYPSIYARGPGPNAIMPGGNVAYAPDDPDTLFVPIVSDFGGKSTDGGKSWTAMPGDIRVASSGNAGGVIAALSADVLIQRETNHGKIMWSKDGGIEWDKLIVGTDIESYVSDPAYWVAHRPLIADKYVANQAWLYLVGNGNGDAEDLAYRGIWRLNYDPGTEVMSTTRVKGPSSPYITGNYSADFWHVRFAQIGVDDFVFCGGENCLGLWRSTDGMVAWNYFIGTDDVNVGAAGFGEVFGVAVGAGRVSGEKAIYASGWRMNSPSATPTTYDGGGIWMSEGPPETIGEEWVRIEQLINGCTLLPQEVAADPQIYGLGYAGLVSEGIARWRYQDKRAWS